MASSLWSHNPCVFYRPVAMALLASERIAGWSRVIGQLLLSGELTRGVSDCRSHGRGIWGKLLSLCEIPHCEGILFSIFQGLFASVDEVFILGRRLRAGL